MKKLFLLLMILTHGAFLMSDPPPGPFVDYENRGDECPFDIGSCKN